MLGRYRGGERVGGGTYWNVRTGDYVTVGKEGGFLPYSEGEYIRAHPALILLVGPWLGLAYIIFLPLALPVMLAQFAAKRVARGLELVFRPTRR